MKLPRTLVGWLTSQPNPIHRAQIRGLTGCDDSTIKNVFAELAGGSPARWPSDASRMRVIDAGKAIGLITPSNAAERAA